MTGLLCPHRIWVPVDILELPVEVWHAPRSPRRVAPGWQELTGRISDSSRHTNVQNAALIRETHAAGHNCARAKRPAARPAPAPSPRAPRVRPRCRFRNRDTWSGSKSGVKRMTGSTTRHCEPCARLGERWPDELALPAVRRGNVQLHLGEGHAVVATSGRLYTHRCFLYNQCG